MTPEAEKALKGLRCCGAKGRFLCDACPYKDSANESVVSCQSILHADAEKLIFRFFGSREEHQREYQRQYHAAHLQEAKLAMRARYEARKAAGICTQCGKNPAAPGRVHCEKCMNAKKEEYRRKKNAKHAE